LAGLGPALLPGPATYLTTGECGVPYTRFILIKPKKRLDKTLMTLELVEEMKRILDGIQEDFEATTETWSHKPKFEQEIKLTKSELVGRVFTRDEIYGYVSLGTKPHPIAPKQARLLRFREVYQAKTEPGVIGSHGGGSSGPIVYAGSVYHPGTKGRRFAQAIAKKWQPIFKQRMTEAFHRAVKRQRQVAS
jgi:hypothetical protein